MKKLAYILCLALFLYHTQCYCISSEDAAFWQTQRKGATYEQSLPIPKAWLQQAKENKIDFIYFKPSALDFSLNKKSDIKKLKSLFDEAQSNNIKVVLELTLIGKQMKKDGSCYFKSATDDTLLSSWNQIANLFKNHAAVVGYSIPTPLRDRQYALKYALEDDLNLFYKNAVASLREIDSETPLILQLKYYNIRDSKTQDPIRKNNILYAVNVSISMPTACIMPIGNNNDPAPWMVSWYNRERIKYRLDRVTDWMGQHQILPQQILVTNFGPPWVLKNTQVSHFTDFVSFFNAYGWNWSYHYAWVKDEH